MNCVEKIKKMIILGVVNHVLTGTRFFNLKRMLLNLCFGIQVGANSKVVGPVYLPLISSLKIGQDTWVGKSLEITGNGNVIIGNHCDIAPTVRFITGSHRMGTHERRAGEGYNGTIVVGDGTWIGAGVLLLPDIQIEDGAVVGAGAVVNRSLQADRVYAGNPAREIKMLE